MNGQIIPLESGLWLVGVPIGTARDITLRALDVLASADCLAAEDTRSLRKLMDIHGIPLGSRRIVSLHDHSNDKTIQSLIARMSAGDSVAYASEAGMPLIADPGFELVRATQVAGFKVTSAPGVSSVTTALALGGLPTDAFHFAGFLPPAKSARKTALMGLADIAATLVLFESPKRLAATLRDAADVLGTDRQARICRELTKKFEEVRVGTLGELAQGAERTRAKGEIVVLIDRPEKRAASDEDIIQALQVALETQSLRDAATQVSVATGAARRDVYQLGLSLKR